MCACVTKYKYNTHRYQGGLTYELRGKKKATKQNKIQKVCI